MLLYYLGSWNWEQGSCKASASSMLREGDWDHITDMIFRFRLLKRYNGREREKNPIREYVVKTRSYFESEVKRGSFLESLRLLCPLHLGNEQLIDICAISEQRYLRNRSAVLYPNVNGIVI